MNPISLFQKWFKEELDQNNLKLQAACCLSTQGLDDYPNARFVSLKEVSEDGFVVTGSMQSRKGKEIESLSKAALTFWWTSTKRQVRIQGDVTQISKEQAEIYFDKRNLESKIVSLAFNAGETTESIEELHKQFRIQEEKYRKSPIKMPVGFGGICINPVRIEFMKFKKSRLHERILYQLIDNQWEIKILQP